jgi:hypothetical protein
MSGGDDQEKNGVRARTDSDQHLGPLTTGVPSPRRIDKKWNEK